MSEIKIKYFIIKYVFYENISKLNHPNVFYEVLIFERMVVSEFCRGLKNK